METATPTHRVAAGGFRNLNGCERGPRRLGRVRASLVLALCLRCLTAVQGGESDALLTAWLETQGRLKTWSAEFTQTRTLRALREPIRTPGRLWFTAPNQFRWELGNPPQTLAVRTPQELIVLYPRLKRAERYPLGGEGREPWRDALALLDAGFPASRAELESRFRIRSVERLEDRAELTLEPVDSRARQFLSQVRLVLREPGFALLANEMRFSDGSVLRNDFTNMVANATFPKEVFALALDEDVKVVEPLKR
ncbi:MAG: outer membrane lipoprotein carrier protein LolA [Verrucomicrobiales bacterium]|nr:outer membrane lipoprotein carrier protein LolA [Verrucomicrobiales bacterium]